MMEGGATQPAHGVWHGHVLEQESLSDLFDSVAALLGAEADGPALMPCASVVCPLVVPPVVLPAGDDDG